MNMTDKAQLIFNAYLKEASLFLPLKNRREIKKELQSDLLDLLEERFEDRELEERDMTDFVKELGSPFSYSCRYGEQNSLLSPAIMPLFQLITLIVMSVLTAVHFFGFFFQDRGFLAYLAQYISTLFSALGAMVIVFAIMDRLVPQWKWDYRDENWDPQSLSPKKPKKEPSLAETVAGWVFGLIFLYIFIFLQDKIGFWYKEQGQWTFVPIFAMGFYKVIPFWIAGIIWDGITQLLKMVQKGWTMLSRAMDLLKSFYEMAILFFLFKAGWTYLFLENSLGGSPLEGLMQMGNGMKTLYPALLILAMIGTLVESIKKGTAMLKA